MNLTPSSMLVNGVLSNSINAADRGLLYGDGVFRTPRIVDGRSRHSPRQCRKLQLAGIRHLNRLEYAPAAEWNDAHD
ncbi:MAG: hypothetical protein ACLQHK_01895 [Gallionellaceae bacterium]